MSNSMKRVMKFAIPVDNQPHEVPSGVPILFGRDGARNPDETVVDGWWEVSDGRFDGLLYTGPTQRVQVAGTGQSVGGNWSWLASFIDGPLARHLYEVR